MSIIKRLSNELEKPREQRPLGSGWLSGGGALLAGLTGLLLVFTLKFPGSFVTPDLMAVHGSGYLRPFLHAVLLIGYGLALLSLLLSKDKVLGGTALALVVIASLLGGSQTTVSDANPTSLYFGLDFFILNVLFVGFLFIPLERFFPHRADQGVFRPEWQEDMFYYLVSSMLVQVLTFLTMAPANFVTSAVDLSDIQNQVKALPFVVQVVIIMVVTDFAQYWFHRMFHSGPLAVEVPCGASFRQEHGLACGRAHAYHRDCPAARRDRLAHVHPRLRPCGDPGLYPDRLFSTPRSCTPISDGISRRSRNSW